MLTIKGSRQTIKALRGFKPSEQRGLVSVPLNSVASLMSKDAKKRIAPRDLAVSKSIGVKAKTYSSAGIIVRMIGPRVFTGGYKNSLGRYVSSQETAIRAKQYEFGQAGRAARPFLRPAFRANKGQALTLLERGIAVQILKKFAKRRAGR